MLWYEQSKAVFMVFHIDAWQEALKRQKCVLILEEIMEVNVL